MSRRTPTSAPTSASSIAMGGVIGGTANATIFNSGDFGALALSTSGNIGNPASLVITPLVAGSTIAQATALTGVAGSPLTVRSGNALDLNHNGGALNLFSGNGNGTGVPGVIHIGDDKAKMVITIGYNLGVGADSISLSGNPVSINSYSGGGAIYLRGSGLLWGAQHHLSDVTDTYGVKTVQAAGSGNTNWKVTAPVLNFSFSQETALTGVDGSSFTLAAQSALDLNHNGGSLILRGGVPNGVGLAGPVQIQIDAAGTVVAEATQVIDGSRVLALCRMSALTAVQMPSGTGDGVIYIANAAAVPSVNSVGGPILYAEAGALKCRGTSGTITTIALA